VGWGESGVCVCGWVGGGTQRRATHLQLSSASSDSDRVCRSTATTPSDCKVVLQHAIQHSLAIQRETNRLVPNRCEPNKQHLSTTRRTVLIQAGCKGILEVAAVVGMVVVAVVAVVVVAKLRRRRLLHSRGNP
jgi:hypothetical protein